MIGRTVGHYRIVEKIGEGGMGVIYKAHDSHLDRFVAIKVLPATDPARRARFAQEARSASALNHPNIITVHDIAEEGGVDFMVMEYVAGKTLDQLIPRKGMRLSEALKIAVQVADALNRAHSAGIVHRDLKPANVMVDDHGHVKVLDFGLAKLSEHHVSQDSATETLNLQTEEGTIVGTAAYMSPEQAQGKPVDARSDIFSFGALLYEMATGQKAFQGDSKMSTLSAVLLKEPAPLSGEVPYDLAKVITRCLKKDPDRRFQHMDDVRIALLELKEESESGTLPSPSPAPRGGRRWTKFAWTGAAVVALVAAAAALRMWPAKTAPEGPVKSTPLTGAPGQESYPSFSGDGSHVAYSWNGPQEDNYDIYVKLVDEAGSSEPLRLTTHPDRDFEPVYSPDGARVAFLRVKTEARAELIVISSLGTGRERKVADIEGLPGLIVRGIWSRTLAWSQDGRWLVVPRCEAPMKPCGLHAIGVDSGEVRRLTEPPPDALGDLNPAFSGDGRNLAFLRLRTTGAAEVYRISLEAGLAPQGQPQVVVTGRSFSYGLDWAPDGRRLILAHGDVLAQGLLWVDALGSGERLLLAVPSELAVQPDLSRDGRRLAFTDVRLDKDILRAPLAGDGKAGENPETLIQSARIEQWPAYSPDGSRIAFASTRSGQSEIWTSDADGSNQAQLTRGGDSPSSAPQWSSDGEWVAFASFQGGKMQIILSRATGGETRRVTTSGDENATPHFSRDGRWVYYTSNKSGSYQIWKSPLHAAASKDEAVQVTRKGGYLPREDPDGRYLYYLRPGNRQPYAVALWRQPTGGGDESIVLEPMMHYASYAVTRTGVYYVRQQHWGTSLFVSFYNFSTSTSIDICRLGSDDYYPSLAVSSDGKWLLFARQSSKHSVMLVQDPR